MNSLLSFWLSIETIAILSPFVGLPASQTDWPNFRSVQHS